MSGRRIRSRLHGAAVSAPHGCEAQGHDIGACHPLCILAGRPVVCTAVISALGLRSDASVVREATVTEPPEPFGERQVAPRLGLSPRSLDSSTVTCSPMRRIALDRLCRRVRQFVLHPCTAIDSCNKSPAPSQTTHASAHRAQPSLASSMPRNDEFPSERISRDLAHAEIRDPVLHVRLYCFAVISSTGCANRLQAGRSMTGGRRDHFPFRIRAGTGDVRGHARLLLGLVSSCTWDH